MPDVTAQTESPQQAENILARVSQQLAKLEKRDWEQWLTVAITGTLLAAGLLALTFPAAFLGGDDVHFEIRVSRVLFLGLFTLLVLFNTYMVWRRLELRRVREELISTTIQSELVRLQSFTDPLTEIYNRRALDDMAGRYISHARRTHKPLSFVLIDADRFREVNTKFGHLTGDFVLAEIAALLRNSVRGSDAVVRYGGDEFLLILADSPRAGTVTVVNRVANYLTEWNRAGNLEGFSLSLSIGVAEWKDGRTLDEVLDEADRDMYARKKEQALPAN
jgi:diguanylate cyclase (GGDEF)-like protein